MSGINRIRIISGSLSKDWQIKFSDAHNELANSLYRSIFNLVDGDIVSQTDRYSKLGKMDAEEGIDIVLTTKDGKTITIQEKILSYHKSTLTSETLKGNGDIGAWDYCKADFYLIAYSRQWGYRNNDNGFLPYDNPIVAFQDWILVDFNLLKQDMSIKWRIGKNKHDGREADFKWVYFDEIPQHVIVAKMGDDPNSIHFPKINDTPDVSPRISYTFLDILVKCPIPDTNNVTYAEVLRLLRQSHGNHDRYTIHFDPSPSQKVFASRGTMQYSTQLLHDVAKVVGYGNIAHWQRVVINKTLT